MLTKEQVLTIHTHAQKILSDCSPFLIDHALAILEQTEKAVKEINGLRWQEEADKSATLTYQGQKMGRVSRVGPMFIGVILHEYDPKSDSDETQVYQGQLYYGAQKTVENNVRNILAARGEVLHV